MRKRKHEEHTNHEAWAIPYADLMTLLLAFFVVMYAVSVVNEGKYRVMSQSLAQAFNGSSDGNPAPAPAAAAKGNDSAAASIEQSRTAASPIALPISMRAPPTAGVRRHPGTGMETLQQIENQVRRALQPLIDQKMVVVRRKQDWLEIEIRTDILFPSGVAQLSTSANLVLRQLAAILAPFPNPLRVEGFTDDVPINTPQYPSNWELSAARAASVARLFASNGVDPGRLGIIGWGEVRPLAENTNAENRNQNRRVLVVVMNDVTSPQRQLGDADHLRDIAAERAPVESAESLPAVTVKPVARPLVAPRTDLPVVPSIIAVDRATVAPPMPAADDASPATPATPRRVSPDL